MPERPAPEIFSRMLFGTSIRECKDKRICVRCRKEAKEFRDLTSEQEYEISCLCQECQDWAFGPEEEDGKVQDR